MFLECRMREDSLVEDSLFDLLQLLFVVEQVLDGIDNLLVLFLGAGVLQLVSSLLINALRPK